MGAIAATMSSIMMLAVFALVAGGLTLIVRKRDARKGGLMLVAAVVLLVNVLIWMLPGGPEPAAPAAYRDNRPPTS